MSIQLEGTILFGEDETTPPPVDVSADVYRVTIQERRETSTRRPTYGNATRTERAGAASNQAVVAFVQDLDPTTSPAWDEATKAIRRDDARMYLSATKKPGAVSASNPRYHGYVVVTAVDTGGEVGSELEQEQTWSFDEAGFTIDTGV